MKEREVQFIASPIEPVCDRCVLFHPDWVPGAAEYLRFSHHNKRGKSLTQSNSFLNSRFLDHDKIQLKLNVNSTMRKHTGRHGMAQAEALEAVSEVNPRCNSSNVRLVMKRTLQFSSSLPIALTRRNV
jgi:hypothetical protein